MTALSRSISLLTLLMLATSCDVRENGLGPGTSNPDRTAPTVVSMLPAPNTGQVPRTSAISITFSEPMATSSMINSTFTISPGISAGAPSYSGNTATIVPTAPLAGNTQYTVTVTTAAEDRAGNNLVAPVSWSFITDPAPILSR